MQDTQTKQLKKITLILEHGRDDEIIRWMQDKRKEGFTQTGLLRNLLTGKMTEENEKKR